MASRSFRNRLGESTNIWPGFVDVLATLLIVIIFVLMIFTVSQIYLSDAISGRDKALQELRIQINELSKILQSDRRFSPLLRSRECGSFRLVPSWRGWSGRCTRLGCQSSESLGS